MTEPSIVEFNGVTRRYTPDRGVDDVSLAVRRGECIALLGRNGSGKSTLTRLLLGIERPDIGTVRVMETDPANRNRAHLASIGVCLDIAPHWEDLPGRENARFFAHVSGVSAGGIESRIDELFHMAGLDVQADDPVRMWSFGMRRKLGIVEAMIHNPPLLVLDEPTSGIDPQFLLQLADHIRARSRSGLTTWIAGNDPDWVAGVATHAVFMDTGEIVERGTVEGLMALVKTTQEITVELDGPRMIPVMCEDGVQSFAQDGMILRIITSADPALVANIMQWIARHGGAPRRIEIRSPSLKDVYLMKTGRSLDT